MDPTQWQLPFEVIVGALFVIVCLRANATYWVGRLAAGGARRTRLARLLDSNGYRRACDRIDRFGAPVVAVSFLTIGFQTVANLAAGTTAMKQRHYLPAVAVGGLAWALVYATLGTVSLDLLARLFGYSPILAVALVVTVVVAISAYVLVALHRPSAAATQS